LNHWKEKRKSSYQTTFPAISGLWANPTVVNNVETIAAVPWIVNNSGAEYAKIGIGRSTGTKLISASGHIKPRCL
jgi:NADH-quinone oxidoreductase subunit F